MQPTQIFWVDYLPLAAFGSRLYQIKEANSNRVIRSSTDRDWCDKECAKLNAEAGHANA